MAGVGEGTACQCMIDTVDQASLSCELIGLEAKFVCVSLGVR